MINKEDISGDEITTFKAKVIITVTTRGPLSISPKGFLRCPRQLFPIFYAIIVNMCGEININ